MPFVQIVQAIKTALKHDLPYSQQPTSIDPLNINKIRKHKKHKTRPLSYMTQFTTYKKQLKSESLEHVHFKDENKSRPCIRK